MTAHCSLLHQLLRRLLCLADLATVISAALAWVMWQRYTRTGKLMPAGMVAGLRCDGCTVWWARALRAACRRGAAATGSREHRCQPWPVALLRHL